MCCLPVRHAALLVFGGREVLCAGFLRIPNSVIASRGLLWPLWFHTCVGASDSLSTSSLLLPCAPRGSLAKHHRPAQSHARTGDEGGGRHRVVSLRAAPAFTAGNSRRRFYTSARRAESNASGPSSAALRRDLVVILGGRPRYPRWAPGLKEISCAGGCSSDNGLRGQCGPERAERSQPSCFRAAARSVSVKGWCGDEIFRRRGEQMSPAG